MDQGSISPRFLIGGGIAIGMFVLCGVCCVFAVAVGGISESAAVSASTPRATRPRPTLVTFGEAAEAEPAATPVAIATPAPPTETPLAAATPIPPTATPASPEEGLRLLLEEAVGESNRDVIRVPSVAMTLDVITIRWSINDNLSEDNIKASAKIDIKNMLRAMQEAGTVYGLVNFEGTFSLIDQAGNSSEEVVVWATYEAATVDQINWPQFLYEDMYDLATTSKQHPLFAE